jgi:hypothetical protein
MSDEQPITAIGSEADPQSADNTATAVSQTPPASNPAFVDDEEQKQSTKLGRKVARMENDMQTFINEMRSFMNNSSVSKIDNAPLSDDLPEIVATPDDVRKVLTHVQKEESRKTMKYQNDYRLELARLGVNEADHLEIVDEMMKLFNVRHSDMGNYDAALNYERSKNSLMMKKLSSNRPNVQGKSGASTSFGVIGSSAISAPAPVELDDSARKLANAWGMTEEQIKKALSK